MSYDSNWDQVVTLLHMEGADASEVFTDATGRHTYTNTTSLPQIDTAQFKFGSASCIIPGTGDVLSTPDSADWAFGSGDFTIEFWLRAATTPVGSGAGIVGFTDALSPILINHAASTALTVYLSSDGATYNIASGISIGTIATGQWYHVALVRYGSSFKGYIDGVGTAVATSASALFDSANALTLGQNISGFGASKFDGWIDDFRITKGVARYTANFTPPTETFADNGPIADIAASLPLKTTFIWDIVPGDIEASLPLKTISMLGGAEGVTSVLPAKLSDFEGRTGEIGSVEATLPLKDLVFTGVTGGIGSIEGDMPVKEMTGESLSEITGAFAGTIPLKVFDVAGLTGTLATLDVTLPLKEFVANTLNGIDEVLPAKTIDIEGATGQIATIDVTFSALTCELVGIESGFGSITAELPAKSAVMTGVDSSFATINIALPAKRFTVVGVTGQVGSVTASLPAKTSSITGYGTITAALALTLPMLQIAMSGNAALPATYRTWALNMKNKALTEYLAFTFNSFATFNGAVLGASAGGIFVLGTQSTDNGVAIDATVRDGAMEYGSSMLKRVPRIYVAGEQDGDMIFRTICTESGTRSYLLPFNGAGLRSRRVPVGKGPKSRFWSWEIANQNGAGFSYSSVALYPEVLRRRVA